MALTDQQRAQLIDAQPFIASAEWDRLDAAMAQVSGAETDAYFSTLLTAAGKSLGWLQYILEEPDALMFSPSSRLSGQIRPAANAITQLEAVAANGTRLLCRGIYLVNTGATADQVTLFHLPAGVAVGSAGNQHIIRQFNLPASPDGTLPVYLDLPLQPGQTLALRSTQGATSASSYVE
jgi:hypothetical protein